MRCVTVSKREIQRSKILQELVEEKLSRGQASTLLKISLRQLDRLKQKYNAEGLEGLCHGNRGKPSNNRLSREKREKIVKCISEHYADFGPTLVSEKLAEQHGVSISKEKVRQIMNEEGYWHARRRKVKGYHPRRQRRSRFGELLQGDCSHHRWFEDRASGCALIAFIDDSTNRVTARFGDSESTLGYMSLFRSYVERHGVPLALYVDKHSVFRVNSSDKGEKGGETEFHRLLKELGVELICANSPQAKGRIERLFKTLQDRLVKEMRLRGISSIEEGNRFLEVFLKDFEVRWSCEPLDGEDAHRRCPSKKELDRIFTKREERKLSKALDFSYGGKLYQVVNCKTPNRFAHKRITILEGLSGDRWYECEGKRVEVSLCASLRERPPVLDSKELTPMLDRKTAMTGIQRHRRGLGCLR